MTDETTTTPPPSFAKVGQFHTDRAIQMIAADLFMDPDGVRAIALNLLATFSSFPGEKRPPQPMEFHVSICHLLRCLAAAHASPTCDLTIMAWEKTGRKMGFAFRFFADWMGIAMTHYMLIREGRYRTLKAFSDLISPALYRRQHEFPFMRADAGGIRGEVICNLFRGNEVLRSLIDTLYLIIALLDVIFYEALRRWKPLNENPSLFFPLAIAVQGQLATLSTEADDRGDIHAADCFAHLSLIFHTHCNNYIELGHAIHTIAVDRYDGMRAWGHWIIYDTRNLQVTYLNRKRAKRLREVRPAKRRPKEKEVTPPSHHVEALQPGVDSHPTVLDEGLDNTPMDLDT